MNKVISIRSKQENEIFYYYQKLLFLFLFFFCIYFLTGSANIYGQSYTLFPQDNSENISPDTRLLITFDRPVVLGNSGQIRIFDTSNDSLVDMLDMSIPPGPRNNRTPSPYDTLSYPGVPDKFYSVYEPDLDSTHVYQVNYLGGNTPADAFHFFPVLIHDNVAEICLHNLSLEYNKTYYVEIDPEVFPFSDGSFPGISGNETWNFQTKAEGPLVDQDLFIISKDGNGDFHTLQGAIEYIPEENELHRTLLLKNGIYNEIIYFRNKRNFTVLGESQDSVIVQYANNGVFNYHDISPDPELEQEFHYTRAVVAFEESDNVSLINFTIISLGEEPAQAEGLLAVGDRIQIHNIRIFGSGDALQSSGRVYVNESSVRGFGDNILGYGAIFFNRSDFISTYGPHMWVRNTDANHGNIFVDCRFWTEGNVETDFARAPTNHGINYPYVEAVLLNCAIDGIRSRGWGEVGPEKDNIHYWEYNSTNLEDGSPADVSNRASYSKQLTMESDSQLIADYSNPTFILDGWTPEQAPIILSNPDSIRANYGWKVTMNVRSAAAPNRYYQWFKDGIELEGRNGINLNIDSVNAGDEGAYSVKVWNELGSDSSLLYHLIIDTSLVDTSAVDTGNVSDALIQTKNNKPLKIYPNPSFNDKIIVEFHSKKSGYFHSIAYNLSGKEVIRWGPNAMEVGMNSIQYNLKKAPPGIYLLKIIYEDGKHFTDKFIVAPE